MSDQLEILHGLKFNEIISKSELHTYRSYCYNKFLTKDEINHTISRSDYCKG